MSLTNAENLNVFIDELMVLGFPILREFAVTASRINTTTGGPALDGFDSVKIPIVTGFGPNPATDNVVPGAVLDQASSLETTMIDFDLDQWKHKFFYLDDRDIREIASGTQTQIAIAAMKGLVNLVDNAVISEMYLNSYQVVGTIGADTYTTSVINAGATKLDKALAPPGDRTFMVNSDVAGKLKDIRAFADASFLGAGNTTTQTGQLPNALGFVPYQNQNLNTVTHTAGTQGGIGGGSRRSTGSVDQVGDTVIPIASMAAGDYVVGDIVTFSDGTANFTDDVTYVVKAITGTTSITLDRGLEAQSPRGTKVNCLGTHKVNLMFQRTGVNMVNRSLSTDRLNTSSVVDPVSGLSFRSSLTEQNKRTAVDFDILYGVKTVRPNHVVRFIS